MTTIVHFEDDTFVVERYRPAIEQAGWLYVWIPEPREDPVTTALSHRADLVLSDILMPYRTGFDILMALRSDPRTRAIPVLLLTTQESDVKQARARMMGVADYLIKQRTTPDDLVDRIREIMLVDPNP